MKNLWFFASKLCNRCYFVKYPLTNRVIIDSLQSVFTAKSHKMILKQQQGIALITVMLITGITAIIATEITTHQNRSADRTVQLINSDQGILSIWSVENFVKIVLADDMKESRADFPEEDWTIGVTVPVDGGTISGKLVDETAKYNINNIISKGKLRANKKGEIIEANRLLNLFNKLNIEEAEELISAIIDWMDSDSNVYRGLKPFEGAEDSYYSRLDPPYRAANNILFDISELKLIKGMTPDIYRKIIPFLTVLPEYTAVNANFAKSEVLAMLSEDITPEAINQILKKQNKKNAFQSYNQLIGEIQTYSESSSASNRIAQELTGDVIGVSAQYFRLKASIYLDQSVTNASSLLKKKDNKINVVWRTFGSWDD